MPHNELPSLLGRLIGERQVNQLPLPRVFRYISTTQRIDIVLVAHPCVVKIGFFDIGFVAVD